MVQAKILASLFAGQVRKGLVLKGGFAMRVVALSTRYTKDIDLAADSALSPQDVQNRVRAALRSLKSSGLLADARWTEPKQTDTTMRWKVAGRVGESELNVTVEVSRRDRLDETHLVSTTYSGSPLGPIPVDCFDAEAIALSKLDCLANPQREAPRDVHDLFVLITAEVRPPKELLERLGEAKIAAIRDAVWGKIEKMDYVQFAEKLKPYLPRAEADRIGAAEWDHIRLTVGERVQEWLSDFADGCPPAAPIL
jgi:predicted nucleotidyltransferase component of viral defense system